MITKIKIQITIVADCNESGMCKKNLSMQIYGFELFKYSLFVIFNNVYYSVFLTNNLYQ